MFRRLRRRKQSALQASSLEPIVPSGTTSPSITASSVDPGERPPILAPIKLTESQRNGLCWKDRRGLGDVRAVRLLLLHVLPQQAVDRVLHEAECFYAIAYLSTTRDHIESETSECLVSVSLNKAQCLSLAQASVRLRGTCRMPYCQDDYEVMLDSGTPIEPRTVYSYNVGGASGKLWLHRHHCDKDFLTLTPGTPKYWHSPDIVWEEESEELGHLRREGVLTISARGWQYRKWGHLKDTTTVELWFYPNDVDYASFVLSNGF